jgi:hypothetical protein
LKEFQQGKSPENSSHRKSGVYILPAGSTIGMIGSMEFHETTQRGPLLGKMEREKRYSGSWGCEVKADG